MENNTTSQEKKCAMNILWDSDSLETNLLRYAEIGACHWVQNICRMRRPEDVISYGELAYELEAVLKDKLRQAHEIQARFEEAEE